MYEPIVNITYMLAHQLFSYYLRTFSFSIKCKKILNSHTYFFYSNSIITKTQIDSLVKYTIY